MKNIIIAILITTTSAFATFHTGGNNNNTYRGYGQQGGGDTAYGNYLDTVYNPNGWEEDKNGWKTGYSN